MIDNSNDTHIWYLYHSGFAVKISNHFLIFDYFKEDPDEDSSYSGLEVLDLVDLQNNDVFIFSSHGHFDHFSPAIFDWENRTKRIQYILSDDIEAGKDRKNVLRVRPGQNYDFEGINIEVLDSTDLGVSFLVKCGGIVLFHAGDLNWWHWKGEPEDENHEMGENYKKQIDLLRGTKIDLAFIPVDPRLEEYYYLGLSYFMKTVGAKMVFPMHFGNDYSVFEWLKRDRYAAEYMQEIVEITPSTRHFVYKRNNEKS